MLQSIYDILVDISRFAFLLCALFVLYAMVSRSLTEFSYRRALVHGHSGRFLGYITVIGSQNPELMGQRFGLKWENSIGSGKRNDITLPDDSVNRSHGIIYWHKGRAYVGEMGCPVFVNEDPVKKRAELFDGDEVRLGDLYTRIRLEEWEAEL